MYHEIGILGFTEPCDTQNRKRGVCVVDTRKSFPAVLKENGKSVRVGCTVPYAHMVRYMDIWNGITVHKKTQTRQIRGKEVFYEEH